MKKLLILLMCFALIAAGCKGGNNRAADNQTGIATGTAETAEAAAGTASKAVAGEGFSFDELFKIFSIFGDNIMTPAFASQSAKDGIKDELRNLYEAYTEFSGPCNITAYSLMSGDCHNGFQMACYRYKADDHVLVILLENGGCDVSSVKYIRAYEYDPASNNAHEIELPFQPMPKRDDFEDLVRLAGADVSSLRSAMQAGLYDYAFRLDGMTIRLDDPMDFDEQVYKGDLVVDYLWDGSELVRNKDYRYACIHPGGFASIQLGQPAPNFRIDYDPLGYDVTYSQGGDLWLINRGEEDTLEIQMENNQVYSIETRSPRFCVANYAYTPQPGKKQPYVGCRINDCLTLGQEDTTVTMLMDGTVQIVVDTWGSKIAFRTSKDSLTVPVEPSLDGPRTLGNPQFKPDAKIESILLWRD